MPNCILDIHIRPVVGKSLMIALKKLIWYKKKKLPTFYKPVSENLLIKLSGKLNKKQKSPQNIKVWKQVNRKIHGPYPIPWQIDPRICKSTYIECSMYHDNDHEKGQNCISIVETEGWKIIRRVVHKFNCPTTRHMYIQFR